MDTEGKNSTAETPTENNKSPTENNKGVGDTLVSDDNNLRILYITFAIITGVLLLWIIITVSTSEDPLKILGEMNNLSSQIPSASDNTAQS